MATIKSKTIRFNNTDKDLLEFAETKGNFNAYMKALIKKDKENYFGFNEYQKKAIIEIIKDFIGLNNINVSYNSIEPTQPDFDEETLNALSQFDDM